MALLIWLHAQVPLRESNTGALCAKAAQGGHLAALRANGAPWHEQIGMAAAEYGHVAVLQWAHENTTPWIS